MLIATFFCMKSLNIIFKSAILVFFGIMFSRLFGYLFRLIIARSGLEIYGSYSFALSVIQFAMPFALIGLGGGLLRYLGHYSGKKDNERINLAVSTSIKIVFVLSFFVFLLFFFFSEQIASMLNKPNLGEYLRVFSWLIPINAFIAIFAAILKANHRIEKLVLGTSIVQSALEVALLITLFRKGFEFQAISISIILSTFVSLLILFIFSRKDYEFKFKGFDKELVLFSLPLLPGTAYVFTSLVDTLFLGYFSTVKDVALYNAALPTAQMLLIFPYSFLAVFLPLIARKHAENYSIKQEYNFVVKWIFIFTIPCLLFVFLFSGEMMHYLFGEKYIPAAVSFIFLTAAYFIYGFGLPSGNLFQMIKKTKINLFITLITFFLNIILNFVFIPISLSYFGNAVYGVSFATLLTFLITGSLTIAWAYRLTGKHPFKFIYLKIIFSSLASLLVVFIIGKFSSIDGLFYLALIGIFYLLIYAIINHLFGVFDNRDALVLKNIYNNLRFKTRSKEKIISSESIDE